MCRMNLTMLPTEDRCPHTVSRFPSDFNHISDDEKRWFSRVEETHGESTPFWINVSGRQARLYDQMVDPKRYQAVVNHFRDQIEFVQVGEDGHHHPPLEGSST